jgi:hypothetical protein
VDEPEGAASDTQAAGCGRMDQRATEPLARRYQGADSVDLRRNVGVGSLLALLGGLADDSPLLYTQRRGRGILGSSLPARNAQATPKIRHLGDVPSNGACYRDGVLQRSGADESRSFMKER